MQSGPPPDHGGIHRQDAAGKGRYHGLMEPVAQPVSLGGIPLFGQSAGSTPFARDATPGSALPVRTLRNSATSLVTIRSIRKDQPPPGPAQAGAGGQIKILHAGHGEQIGERLHLAQQTTTTSVGGALGAGGILVESTARDGDSHRDRLMRTILVTLPLQGIDVLPEVAASPRAC